MAVAKLDIEERTFVSTWSGKMYIGWYLDAKMVGCNCGYAQHHPGKCKHVDQYNSALESITGQDVVQHVEDELNTSCCICGGYTKNVICYRCIA